MSPSARSALVGWALLSALASPSGESNPGAHAGARGAAAAMAEHGPAICGHEPHRDHLGEVTICPCGGAASAHRAKADRIAAARPVGAPRPRTGLAHHHGRRHASRTGGATGALAAGTGAERRRPATGARRRRGVRARRRAHSASDHDRPARHTHRARGAERLRVEPRERAVRPKAPVRSVGLPVEASLHQDPLAHSAVAMLAHDLRNPINAIAMTSRALLARGGLEARQAEAIDRIASVARRMQALVGELLDLARVRQAGGFTLARRAARIEAICARAIHSQVDAHPGGRVELALCGPGDGEWDESRLEQVVSNLVENALERAREGSVVDVRVRGCADEVVLGVHNHGPVIPPAAMPDLFEPFRRCDRGGTLGLGLFLVREIVRAHGGAVFVTSSEAAGTRFEVRLPRRAPQGPAANA